MRQDASSKNPGHPSGGSFELDLSVFFGNFLCAKESYSRTSAKKVPCFTCTQSLSCFSLGNIADSQASIGTKQANTAIFSSISISK
jgi:hypothetical protein